MSGSSSLDTASSNGWSDDADIGQWAPEGSAAAAALYVMEKISSIKCYSRVLCNLRQCKVVEHILRLIEVAVDDYQDANTGSGGESQVNIHANNFQNDKEGDKDQGHDDQTDDNSQYQYDKEHILLRLMDRSLSSLIQELILQIL